MHRFLVFGFLPMVFSVSAKADPRPDMSEIQCQVKDAISQKVITVFKREKTGSHWYSPVEYPSDFSVTHENITITIKRHYEGIRIQGFENDDTNSRELVYTTISSLPIETVGVVKVDGKIVVICKSE